MGRDYTLDFSHSAKFLFQGDPEGAIWRGIVSAEASYKKLVEEMTPGENARLSKSSEPLSPDKQKWLNHAFAQVRALKSFTKDPLVLNALTNIGATLILVDSE